MDKRVAKVLNGFVALQESQRDEFIEELNKFLSGKVKEEVLRKSIQESTTINFGPVPSGCPCCGR